MSLLMTQTWRAQSGRFRPHGGRKTNLVESCVIYVHYVQEEEEKNASCCEEKKRIKVQMTQFSV